MSKQTVNERISIFLKSKRYSVNALSKELDVGQRTLNNQLTGVTSLGCGTVCAIAERFPELSAEWLLRGIGPMISDGVPHIYQVNDGGDNIQGSTITKADCHQFIEMLQEKDRQIAKLIDILERK